MRLGANQGDRVTKHAGQRVERLVEHAHMIKDTRHGPHINIVRILLAVVDFTKVKIINDLNGHANEFVILQNVQLINFNIEYYPNMENIHNHLKSLFDGKIGKFAKELAEELTEEFSSLGGEQSNTSDLLKQMMKNPKKIMDLVKTIGEKIKQKMETGEISKEEMMGEASEILNKMKEMGGQKEFNKMFKNFAGGMGKNSKINMSALQSMAKQEATRERMRSKIQKKKEYTINESDPNNLVFKINEEEKQERSTVAPSQTDEELISMFDDVKVEPVAKPKKSKKGKKTKK